MCFFDIATSFSIQSIAALLSSVFISQTDKLNNIANNVLCVAVHQAVLDLSRQATIKNVDKIYQALTNQDSDIDFSMEDDNRHIKKQWLDAGLQYQELSKDALFKYLITTEDGQKLSDEIMGDISKIFREEIPRFFSKQQYKDSLFGIFYELIETVTDCCFREYLIHREKLEDEKQAAITKLQFLPTPIKPEERERRLQRINKDFDLNMFRLKQRYFHDNVFEHFQKFDEQVNYMRDLQVLIGDQKVWHFLRVLLMNCWYDIIPDKNDKKVPHELLYQDMKTFSRDRIKRILEEECEKMDTIVKSDEINDAKKNRNKKGKEHKDRMDQRV